jgi:TonB family protein
MTGFCLSDHHVSSQNRLSAALFVVLLHVAALMALLAHFGPSPSISNSPSAGELAVRLIDSPAAQVASITPVPEPKLAVPAAEVIDEPQITFRDDLESAAPVLSNPQITAPPRPDPGYLNPNPALPERWHASRQLFQVTLLLFVESDGHVSRSSVQISCGKVQLDHQAQSFVRARWRFRPAQEGVLPVADWTTVVVTFI